MKKIIVLAGGADQIALIQELKKRGYQIVLVDYFENPPAKAFAHKHIVASTLDIEKVRQIAIEEKADLICTACTDQALLTMAKVSEDLHLPCYLSYQTALNVTNKSYMKQVMISHGIPTAKHIITDDANLSLLQDFQFPLVVKPVDCNSSKGVRRVDNAEHFLELLQEAIDLSRTHTAVVEEYKEGREISADFYIEGNEVKYLCSTISNKIEGNDAFTIIQSLYPALNRTQEKALISIANQIAQAFQLSDTPLLVQLIEKDGKFNVLEFSARMGGGSKYHLIKTLSGVDIMAKYVDLILGNKPSVQPKPMIEFAAMNYIYCIPGVISKMEGFEALKADGVIKDWFEYKTVGMQIDHAHTSGDRPAGYLVVADSQSELEHKQRLADQRIHILDSQGKDIMLHDLVPLS